jgi:hypothetical protein
MSDKIKTYKLETIFLAAGLEKDSDRAINGQSEYDAVYTARAEKHTDYIQWHSDVQGVYLSDDFGWINTDEDQQDMREMMEASIFSGEAHAI